MKIGLLAYHAACNFGAFLQLLSTVEYIKKQGDEPRVINWVPRDFRKDYEKRSPSEVRKLYSALQQQYYPLTKLCESSKEVAEVIEKEGIEAVIIGSDAVCQHHPFRERFNFPVKRIVYYAKITSDRLYPNCFWGDFNKYLKKPIRIAMISGSSQDSKYYYISGKTKRKMKESIESFSYLSVRDDWSRKMISYLTDGKVIPDITPDPVFAFNHNASHFVPSKEEILSKYKIPGDYVILSFKGPKSVDQQWIDEFHKMANQKGLCCVKLPYADAPAFGDIAISVGEAITPLDWYALIKYSKGYVGNNMHPIVTSITCGIPFFSFDNYGISKMNGQATNGETSKIYHILKKADLLENRVYTRGQDYIPPTPNRVFDLLISFDINKEMAFAKEYYSEYLDMMNSVYTNINK